MDKLKLRVGDAEVIAIRTLPGTLKTSSIPNRPSDVMFTLVDGRVAFLPMSVADRIYAANIRPGQNFEIRKSSQFNYQLKALGAASAVSAAPAAVAPQTASTTYNGNHTPVPATPPVPPPPPPPPPARQPVPSPNPEPAKNNQSNSKLMGCFAMAVDAIAEAQAYCQRKGLGIIFNSEDVRAVAISCYIQCAKDGGLR